MTITINNLTINVSGTPARQENPFEYLLAGLAIHAVGTPGDELDRSDLDKEDADLIKYKLVEFLQPNRRFTLRTLLAIAREFSEYQLIEIKEALDQLENEGAVSTKRRRADGETLYVADVESYADVVGDQIRAAHATEAAHAAEQAGPVPTPGDSANEAPVTPQYPEMTIKEVQDFLDSDERYERRSLGAIQRHFGSTPAQTAASYLQNMVAWGYIEPSVGRDGTLYYSLK